MAAVLAANNAFAETATAPQPRASGARGDVHIVESGQSLWTIARGYGCEVDELRRANKLRDNMIYAGQQLRLPATCARATASPAEPAPAPARVAAAEHDPSLVMYEVQPGDSLYVIARKYDSSVDDIKARNGLADNLIMAGQTIEVMPGSKDAIAIRGQSVGAPARGKLVRAARLTAGRGYYVRRPERSYGTNHMVHHIKRAVRTVRSKYPKVHALAIGDLSVKNGGKITLHRSHQSGRDVDVGFYFVKRPKGYPESFVVATGKNLDFAATWLLIRSFAATADSPTGVERMFLDYGVQKLIYQWAKNNGVSDAVLRGLFQYPHGADAPVGLIRHEPGHADHLHIRFKCPENDKGCR